MASSWFSRVKETSSWYLLARPPERLSRTSQPHPPLRRRALPIRLPVSHHGFPFPFLYTYPGWHAIAIAIPESVASQQRLRLWGTTVCDRTTGRCKVLFHLGSYYSQNAMATLLMSSWYCALSGHCVPHSINSSTSCTPEKCCWSRLRLCKEEHL